METLQKLKYRLIDKIMLSRNEQLLDALDKILSSGEQEEKIQLTSEQIEMLIMSEDDIKNNRLNFRRKLSDFNPFRVRNP